MEEDFKRHGFVLLRGLLSGSEELTNLQKAIWSTVSLRSKAKPKFENREAIDSTLIELYRQDPRHVSFVYDVLKYSPALSKLLASKQLLDEVGKLFGVGPEPIVLNNLNLRVDMPGKDWTENLPWHQDWPYNNPLYRLGNSFASWVAVFDVPGSCGPMELKIGSHVIGEVEPEKVRQAGDHKRLDEYIYQVPVSISDSVEFENIQPELRAGDVILFDLALVHRSGINSSPLIRWSAQARYHNASHPEFLEKYA